MDERKTLLDLLAETYGCPKNELQELVYSRMTPQIQHAVAVTTCMPKPQLQREAVTA